MMVGFEFMVLEELEKIKFSGSNTGDFYEAYLKTA
jgi:hypothetical protein